ncbi:MAG: endonuclease/exonuclease/phosphatase family protein, partial [Gemmatimonadota bacterium]
RTGAAPRTGTIHRAIAFLLALAAPLAACTPASTSTSAAPSATTPAVTTRTADGADEPSAAAHDALRIVAYNIKHGRGMDGEVELARGAALIRGLDPDLVAVQEVDSAANRSGRIDQAAALGRTTGLDHAFGRFMDYDGGAYGMAVLSRHPVLEVENHRLPDGPEPRTALALRVRVDSPDGPREIVFVGIHLYGDAGERLAQARALTAALRNETRPVILAGDFNSRPDDPVMRHLERAFVRPAKRGERLTFPADRPEREIDYVLFRPADAFTVRRHVVLDETTVSDHRPVVMELVWE